MTLDEHYSYLSDCEKMRRYELAIKQAVKPGQIVLDLGCGAGSLGLMALRAGAAKVFFVESGSIIEAARQTISNAGFGDQAEFFRKNSFELALPERVDVIVCDHVGYFGFDYGILTMLADAQQRFLRPDGILIPEQIDLQLAPIESKKCRKEVARWKDGSVPDDYGWLSGAAANTKYSCLVGPDNLLAGAVALTSLQMGAAVAPYLTWSADYSCARDGRLDGLCGWFDCSLFGDVDMSNSPLNDSRLQRPQAYFPVESPVAVKAGQRLQATVMARPQDDIIAWVIELPDTGKKFAQTTFNGLLLDGANLTRSQPNRLAILNDNGRARQIVLSYCDGKRTVADVQAIVEDQHPDLFPSSEATAQFVTAVLTWDTSG